MEDREYLCLTLSFDHDLVDGAPATRFAADLNRLIESGHGLRALAASAMSQPGGGHGKR